MKNLIVIPKELGNIKLTKSMRKKLIKNKRIDIMKYEDEIEYTLKLDDNNNILAFYYGTGESFILFKQ